MFSDDVPSDVACGSISAATPNRKGRSMTRRYGQSGYVVKKGNMWHGRYYVDLQDRRKRVSVPLGQIDQFTKPEAKRKLRELLEQSGVNTEAHLLQATKMSQTFCKRPHGGGRINCRSSNHPVGKQWAATLTNTYCPDLATFN